jgi:formylmethanofuran dehydrogenase subunit E
MGRDHSLDEFLSESDVSPDEGTDNTTTDQDTSESQDSEASNVEGDEQPSTLTVHSVRSTMAWTADDVPCDACGEVVQRRWRDDGQLVCNTCKEW